MTEPTTLAPAKPAARWEDFIDIFTNPSAVFARRENSGFGVPMLVVTLLMGVIFLATFNAIQPIFEAEFNRQMAKAASQNAAMTAERITQAKQMSLVFARVGVFIGTPVLIFVVGLVLWIIGKLLFGSKQTLNAALMVSSYAAMPRVVATLLGGAQALLMDSSSLVNRYSIGFSPARFLDPDTTSPVLIALLGRFDVFTIWCTILLGIGLAVTGKLSRTQGLIAAAVMWAVGALPEVLGALRQ